MSQFRTLVEIAYSKVFNAQDAIKAKEEIFILIKNYIKMKLGD